MKLGNYFGIKKGELLIRDVVTMMLLISAVLVFASTFVTEMAGNYGNTAMSNEYALSNLSMDSNSGLFGNLKTDTINASGTITQEQNGLWSLVTGAKELVTGVLYTFVTAPNQLGGLIEGIMTDMGVAPTLAQTIKWTIVIALWIIVIFAIITAFLQGAKV